MSCQFNQFNHQTYSYRPQEAEEYEAGLPYLRGMPEAFVRCADVTLVIGGRELPVHSQLLAAKSAFFASMWAGEQSAFTWSQQRTWIQHITASHWRPTPPSVASMCSGRLPHGSASKPAMQPFTAGAAGAQPPADRQVRLLRLHVGRL